MADYNDAGASSGTEPLACVMCRSRKLKCDRTKPACARCRKVDAECVYPESRRKPTFKRRNVKEIEARLAQVEHYLKEVNKGVEDGVDVDISNVVAGDFSPDKLGVDDAATLGDSATGPGPFMRSDGDTYMGNGQLMSLGYSETLPPFEVQEELNNTFFLIPYHFIPIIHSGRYYQAFYGGPMRKPPMSLQYAVWAMAANGHAKYDEYAQLFYQRARQYAEVEEMKVSRPTNPR